MEEKITKPLVTAGNPTKIIFGVIIGAVILGTLTGYMLATKSSRPSTISSISSSSAKNPQQDNRTFRDFAEGTIKARPEPSDLEEYSEGTHVLVRQNAVPVALTSSVVDLSIYENKKVKVFGETQKALKEGWLMDVGKIEEVK